MQRKKILIVEDDKDILELLNIIFLEDGYDVVLSADGEATERLNEIRPDLILLDIRLENSKRNGVEICMALKGVWETKNLPVILLSAEANLKQISEMTGADGYIKKPFDLADLCCKVKILLD